MAADVISRGKPSSREDDLVGRGSTSLEARRWGKSSSDGPYVTSRARTPECTPAPLLTVHFGSSIAGTPVLLLAMIIALGPQCDMLIRHRTGVSTGPSWQITHNGISVPITQVGIVHTQCECNSECKEQCTSHTIMNPTEQRRNVKCELRHCNINVLPIYFGYTKASISINHQTSITFTMTDATDTQHLVAN